MGSSGHAGAMERRAPTLAGSQLDDSAKRLVTTVMNYGSRTITRTEAQFSPDDGQTMVAHERTAYVSSTPNTWAAPSSDSDGYAGVLTRGTGMTFVSSDGRCTFDTVTSQGSRMD